MQDTGINYVVFCLLANGESNRLWLHIDMVFMTFMHIHEWGVNDRLARAVYISPEHMQKLRDLAAHERALLFEQCINSTFKKIFQQKLWLLWVIHCSG